MKPLVPLILFGLLLARVSAAENASFTRGLSLWYDKPAEKWTDALPIGNGRLGAMVFGGVERERLALNEENLTPVECSDRSTATPVGRRCETSANSAPMTQPTIRRAPLRRVASVLPSAIKTHVIKAV